MCVCVYCTLKSVQEEHRNLQALYVKEREKIDELKKTVEMLVSMCPVPRSTFTSKPFFACYFREQRIRS